MTLSTSFSSNVDYLTDEEWNEMTALKDAIHLNPFSVTPEAMEKFTALFVRSLYGKGDDLNISKNHCYMEHNSNFNSPIELINENEPAIADRSKRHSPGTSFEEYCSLHPDALGCKVYDD